jgi:twitching motility protein PilT
MPQGKNYVQEIGELIDVLIEADASDLHLSEGRPPFIRSTGTLEPLSVRGTLDADDMEGFCIAFMGKERYAEFVEVKEMDFSYEHANGIRFRGNAFVRRGLVAIALRAISSKIRTLEELSLPKILETFARKKQGFFLTVGPVGQGKSTTLAALIDLINRERMEHIVTIEDPIEYLFTEDKSIIDQREVRIDTDSFPSALHSLFRQDINVALIGEMRGPQTMSAAVTAAETGHLVFSTLHTNDAAQTIDRIIDTFPAVQQQQIRLQLAGSLLGVFSQRLIPRVAGGRVPAYELLINNNAVASLVREGRTHEINVVIETSAQQGMVSMNQSLAQLVRLGEITPDNAYVHSTDPKGLERLL